MSNTNNQQNGNASVVAGSNGHSGISNHHVPSFAGDFNRPSNDVRATVTQSSNQQYSNTNNNTVTTSHGHLRTPQPDEQYDASHKVRFANAYDPGLAKQQYQQQQLFSGGIQQKLPQHPQPDYGPPYQEQHSQQQMQQQNNCASSMPYESRNDDPSGRPAAF